MGHPLLALLYRSCRHHPNTLNEYHHVDTNEKLSDPSSDIDHGFQHKANVSRPSATPVCQFGSNIGVLATGKITKHNGSLLVIPISQVPAIKLVASVAEEAVKNGSTSSHQ
jgi:hypothetical protein